MESHDTNPTQDKQITIAVPEDRVAEFYAFFGRFLAAEEFGRRGRRGGHRGPRGRHGHGPGCHGRHDGEHRVEEQAPEAPAA